MAVGIGIYPKEKGQNVYYVKALNYRFSLPKLNEKGNPDIKTHPITGNPLSDPTTGEPVIIEFPVEFTQWKTRFSEDGYWSVYVVDKKTPKQIAEYLKMRAKDRKSGIMDEESFLAQTNPDLAARIKQDTAKDEQIAQQSAELEELKAKLASLGGEKKEK